jgi:hypothetical protein
MKNGRTIQLVALFAVVALLGAMSMPVFAGKGHDVCTQVITFAENPDTGVCVAFSTPCAVPAGWVLCPPISETYLTIP